MGHSLGKSQGEAKPGVGRDDATEGLNQSHLGLASQDKAVPRPRAVWPLRWPRICVFHQVLTLRSGPAGGERAGSTTAHGVTMSLNGQGVGPVNPGRRMGHHTDLEAET